MLDMSCSRAYSYSEHPWEFRTTFIASRLLFKYSASIQMRIHVLPSYALNVRTSLLDLRGTAINVARRSHLSALALVGSEVLLYRPRDERATGYFGVARIVGVHPDHHKKDRTWIEFSIRQIFERPLAIGAILGAEHVPDHPYHTYSNAIRKINHAELPAVLEFAGLRLPGGLGEAQTDDLSPSIHGRRLSILRKRRLRYEMLDRYGPGCAFTRKITWSLNGLYCDTQVGHLVPLSNGGFDIITNVLPMSGLAN